LICDENNLDWRDDDDDFLASKGLIQIVIEEHWTLLVKIFSRILSKKFDQKILLSQLPAL